MSEILKTTSTGKNLENAPATNTGERENTIENIEAKHQLTLDILKLVEADDLNAAGDYFSDVLDNKVESNPDQRDAIFNFLANRQQIEISNNIAKKQDEVVQKLDHQSKQSRYTISDTADNYLRQINNAGQDIAKSVDSKFRTADSISFAIRGYEPVLMDVKNTRKNIDFFNDRLIASSRSKKETLHEYKLDFDHGTDKKHLEALEAVSLQDNSDLELTHFIDQDVMQKSVEKLRDTVTKAKAAGESPEEAVLGVLNEKPQTSVPETIKSVVDFIQDIEKMTDLNSGDLASIAKNTEHIRSLLALFDKKATDLLSDGRIHPDVALDINRSLHANLDTAIQLSYKLRRDLDKYFEDESHVLHKAQTSTKSMFR